MKLMRKPIGPRKCQTCSNIHNWYQKNESTVVCLKCGAVYDISDEAAIQEATDA